MRSRALASFSVYLWCFTLAADIASAQNQPSFQGTGELAGGSNISVALAVSADGGVVVGVSESAGGDEAFRWTPGGGIAGLGSLGDGSDFFSSANGVSDDGSVIVGTTAVSSSQTRAFRWTAGNGMVKLNNFFCLLFCPPDIASGHGVSGDGLVVVGAGSDGSNLDPVTKAARWSGGGTSISSIGHLPGGGLFSTGFAASSDGSVIAGSSDASNGTQAFVWDSGALDPLPAIISSRPESAALAISSSGLVIVGSANTSPVDGAVVEAVRWHGTDWGIVETLGMIPGATVPGGRALGVSGDGSIIVGTANDENSDDVAFLWDEVGGMRSLKIELEEEYGLDLDGWTLSQALGISDIDGQGEFTIVGVGLNPSGDTEGWVAFLSPVHCNDGVDNDSDGNTDFGDDPDCIAKGDRSEVPDCNDGLDNDGDGLVDDGADPECSSIDDQSEVNDCSDGYDNDGDGKTDYPADPGCRSPDTPIENPACDDGVDNDGDGKTDYPVEPGCVAADDLSEQYDCGDAIDNDGDGSIDTADWNCGSRADPSEDPDCSDRVDNDGDHRIDYPEAYPACRSPADIFERPQCSDLEDNDSDGNADFPADLGCPAAGAQTENPAIISVGDLLVTDREGRRLFALDPSSGAQTLLSEGAQLSSPQGVAVRASGEIVVADPAGLFEVSSISGAQRRFSGPLQASDSLQVVFDASGDPIVLESDGIGQGTWVYGGIGAGSVLLPVPTLEDPPDLANLAGESLAREPGGDLLVTGMGSAGGLLGDGVFRIDATTLAATNLTPDFSFDKWVDLALESDGKILVVGVDFPLNPGVFRIDPATGVDTPVNDGPDWKTPTAVVVNSAGEIFVADAGDCDGSGCTGGHIAKVDPVSGARTAVWSGGLIQSQMDLAVVTAFPSCSDGIDNDGDGAADYAADAGCTGPTDPSELAECADGLDNDGDGGIDLADLGCENATEAARENPSAECNDGVDNDQDGFIDWDGGASGLIDPQCTSTPWRNRERKSGRRCGLGSELAPPLVLLTLALGRRRRRS
jgi:probable HAF family extracellular repeat protein